MQCLAYSQLHFCPQATNGSGSGFSDYSSSVPSTPSIGQREVRIETIAASSTPTPIRKQSKRRSNIFTVRAQRVEGRLCPPPAPLGPHTHPIPASLWLLH